ncbi:MAG: DNA cytosine methyltransferase [Planctomycetota bacterium]|nr:DNA cytosine methyltransferase [Planctomycetota bacterium]
MLTALDIFAGGGGLTVGLKKAGFHVAGAVEIEPNAFATYKANHPEVMGFKQDVRTIDGKSLLSLSPTGKIDLLAGCPPCQGFSSLTSKYKRPDPRNQLVGEMSRLIKEIKPRAIMMENVPGLADRGKSLFKRFLRVLSKEGYVVRYDVLQVANYGIPQSRRRLVVLAGRGFAIELPEPTHSRSGEDGKQAWRTIREVIYGMPKPVTLKEAIARGGPQAFAWHVVRTMAIQNQRRIRQAKPGRVWTSIPKRLRPECHQDREAGFSNVYGRMRWNQVSPSITGGCTTFSKGRFGHPQANRTISVREAALLQTFPSDYIFDTVYMDYACDMIGNALPCDFAEVLARRCMEALLANPA